MSRHASKSKAAPEELAKKKLPEGGLNQFGFFKYDKHGTLQTTITEEHTEFKRDTGIVAMDCEMVGVGTGLRRVDALAKVSIVNEYGWCLYDKFVKPNVPITHYRTELSGVRPSDLENATPFDVVKEEVAKLLNNHILVGHGVEHDLDVLHLSHPEEATRNTAEYFRGKYGRRLRPALKTLVKNTFGIEIQKGEHSSIDDAQATMAIYQNCQKRWEQSIQPNNGVNRLKRTRDEFKN